MAEDVAPAEEVVIVRTPWWQRVVRGLAIALAAILWLVILLYVVLDTAPGHRFIASQIGNYTTEGGLNIRVGRIRGSLYGRMELADLRVSDPQGVFLTAPVAEIEWHPFAFIGNHVDVTAMRAPLVTFVRSPALKPTVSDPNAPLLPDIDIDIGGLVVDRLVLKPAVTGQSHIISLDGSAHIADRRAQLTVKAGAVRAPGIAGGDRLALVLDARPDDDRLALQVKLDAPANGVVASMSGVAAPLALRIGGRGDWKLWRGKGQAMLGGQSLADLDLGAQNGRFRIRGLTHPGLYMKGPVERLTAPGLAVDIDAMLDKRRADTRMAFKSDALAVAANGAVDFGTNKFGGFTVDARLLTPGAILPNLAGRDVMAHVVLDGPFGTPTINYQLSAAALAFGTTGAEGVTASGIAVIDADHIKVPIKASARRVVGLNAAAGGLLTNVAIDGDFAYANGKLLSDNLRLRSDRIDATAIVVADLPSGHYTGALKGRVNDYTIDGIGIVNLTTDAKLVTIPPSGFGITGHVVARTSKIFNAGAASFLGGNAIVSTDIGYDTNGVATLSNLKVASPQFAVLRGAGRYDPQGGIVFSADAFSKVYGPLTARVNGTVTQPVVVVRAPRPGVGVGLVDLVATIRGKGEAYAVLAKGGTDYGPFGVDLLVKTAPVLTIDIHRGSRFAGVGFDGTVRATPAGPFAGRVQFAGSGVTGTALLSAEGKAQRADVAAHAYAATIPGMVDFTIGRAILNARVVLYPSGPRVLADAQVANLRYGATVIQAARAKVDYANGAGLVQALATGSSGVPFRLAANAKLSPRLWLVALQGQANGIGFRTPQPARIDLAGSSYRLEPTRIDFDKGSARIAALYGKGTQVQARLDKLDLSVVDALVPNLGLGGTATGSLDYAQASAAAVPRIDARLQVGNFTRTTLALVSEPVDIAFIGSLDGSGGEARALVKRGPAAVGRMVATVRPLGGGAGFVQRLLNAPLGGGIRYSGPAATLFSLGGLAGQQLTGGIAVAADFAGQLGQPRLNGVVRADNLTYENTSFGTRLTQMKLAGQFTNDRFELTELQARAGDGTVGARGTVGLAANSGFPINLQVQLNNATLAKSDSLGATATGQIAITNGPDGGLIKGKLVIPDARYEVVFQGQADVPQLAGVRRRADIGRGDPQRGKVAAAAPAGNFKLDLDIRADNKLYVSGMGLESEWQLAMHVGGTSAQPIVSGRADVVRGTYSFSGKRFDLDRGTVRFNGGPLSDPDIDIAASTSTNGITAQIVISGTGQRPQIAFTSTPALPQDEVLSRLLFGSSPENLSPTEAIQLAAALNSLRGSGGGLNPLGKLRSATGIDRLRILGADEATGRGTALAAGQYITKNIYVEIITDSRGFTATQLDIALSKSLSLLSQTGSFGGSGASIKYQKNF
ncbi:translocation/assembly module TamB domain-containing protein [uncultured Sphingomonas sp.]|uniref:translocation/assembly module TamB domain-containing protein n=1 Tax=uncultured Sphingomonas sp. TaxID=158754 RepID=UPI0035CBFBFA